MKIKAYGLKAGDTFVFKEETLNVEYHTGTHVRAGNKKTSVFIKNDETVDLIDSTLSARKKMIDDVVDTGAPD